MKFFTHSINRFAVKAAILTAGLGVLQAILFRLFKGETLLTFTAIFLFISFSMHTIILITVLVNGIRHYKQLQEHILTLGILLLNIPLAALCMYLVFEL
jgi:hypothetical protein